MRRVLVLLASFAVLLGTAGAPANAQATKAEQKYAHQAFNATNANRAHHGLKALAPDDCVKHAAVRQAKLMARQELMFHQDLRRVLRDCGLNLAGENVAYGFPSGTSVVNDGWMKSEGHRANILNTGFRLMGICARKGHNGLWYVAQVFGRKG